MNNKNNNTLIPKLRFKEFEGEWEEKKLGEISKSYSGGTPSTVQKEYYGGSIPFIRSAEIDKEYTELFLTEEGVENSSAKLVQKGTVLIALYGANSGDVAIAKIEGAINQAILCLNSKESNLFIYQFLSFKKNSIISTYIQGGQGNLSGDIVKSVSLSIPTLPEQKKIASTLSSLDELISAQSEKLAALKKHKKGMMQKLFPAKGKNIPEYRFKEFSGEWEENTLGDIATFINGRAYKQEELLDKGKYRVLRVGNFFSNKEWYYSNLELEKNKYCEKGDLLYAWSASFGPKIWNEEKVIYHYHIWKVLEKKEIDKIFLFILLDYETLRIKSQQANGFGLLHITKGAIEGWATYIPKNKKEQEKIATTLSSIDNLISAQAKKIKELKQHKKGLMQGLFPAGA